MPGNFGLLGLRRSSHESVHFKTMPVYGAESQTSNHTQLKQIKTAGRRLVYFQKMPVWSAYANLAP